MPTGFTGNLPPPERSAPTREHLRAMCYFLPMFAVCALLVVLGLVGGDGRKEMSALDRWAAVGIGLVFGAAQMWFFRVSVRELGRRAIAWAFPP